MKVSGWMERRVGSVVVVVVTGLLCAGECAEMRSWGERRGRKRQRGGGALLVKEPVRGK